MNEAYTKVEAGALVQALAYIPVVALTPTRAPKDTQVLLKAPQ